MSTLSTIEASVISVVYRNEENGWAVVSFRDNEKEKHTMVGNFHDLQENEHLKVKGEWIINPQYGQQFKASSYEIIMPTNLDELREYLGSGIIKGVRKKTAENIIKYFGEDTKRIIDEEPHRLAEIRGISERKAELIGQRVKENAEMRNLMLFLGKYGITPAYAVRIYNTYESRVYQVLKENPYQIAADVKGIGFKKADEIATTGGIPKDSHYRIASGIDFVLDEAQGEGHMYLTEEVLIEKSIDLLQVDEAKIVKVLSDKIEHNKVVKVNRNGIPSIYSNICYRVEVNSAKKLLELNVSYDDADINLIYQIEKDFGITLDASQRDAVVNVLCGGMTIVTGGPGTGKTQTTKVIVEYFIRKGKQVLLGAPTGRAAKRMTEVIGMQSQTIHRMLEVEGSDGGGSRFAKNDENPLTQDVILIDEASMIDQFLFNSLLKAIKPPTRLVLVGDVNQLPSVGPGNILNDIINSQKFPVGRLTKIFRQSEDSTIVTNAHAIINGERVNIGKNSADFYFIRTQEKEDTITNIKTMVKERIPRKMGIKPTDVQVLTQIKSRLCGIDNLNKELQEAINPPSPDKNECKINGVVFRAGDKIMQMKNNYKKEIHLNGQKLFGVFNGDSGYIEDVDNENEYVVIVFEDGARSVYTFREMNDVSLSYAITIHKSQGSEYPCIVVPMQDFIPMLSTQRLLYTCITRAKSLVVIIGQEKLFHMLCNNTSSTYRNTGLLELLGA